MPPHHIQKDIIRALVRCESARYSELKPAAVDGNSFTYHLQQVIRDKYVEKLADGSYRLTPTGKALGINAQLTTQEHLEQPHAIFLIVVRDGDRWLLQRRLAQPEYGKLGFIHGEPLLREPLLETAATVLQTKTGLHAEFIVRGSGYIRIFKEAALESFTQFTLLEAHNITGELIERSGNGENLWTEQPDFAAADMIPSMADLVAHIKDPEHFFVELTYGESIS